MPRERNIMAKRQHKDSVVETAVERLMVRVDSFVAAKTQMREDGIREMLSDNTLIKMARDLAPGDRIYQGRRGGKERFKTVREVTFTRKRTRTIVNGEWVYDTMVGEVVVMK
jgi:hypothetical protein